MAESLGREVEAAVGREGEKRSVGGSLAGNGRVQRFCKVVLGCLPGEPYEAFGCGVLLGFQLIEDKRLEVRGITRGGELTVADFLG